MRRAVVVEWLLHCKRSKLQGFTALPLKLFEEIATK